MDAEGVIFESPVVVRVVAKEKRLSYAFFKRTTLSEAIIIV